jgi:hypothetical protein
MHNTDREELVEMMTGETTYLSRNEFTPYFFVTLILRKYAEMLGIDKWFDEENAKLLKSKIEKNIKSNSELNEEGIITKESFFENASMLIAEYLSDNITSPLREEFECANYIGIVSIDTDTIIDLCSKTVMKKCDELKKLRKQILQDRRTKNLSRSNIVSEKESMFNISLNDYIKKDNSYREEYSDKLKNSFINSNIWDKNPKNKVDGDRKFIVFDRDYNSHDRKTYYENYLKIIEKCEKQGYDVLLSTPDFEIWLLMHHDVDCSTFNYETDRHILNDILCKKEGIKENNIKKIDDDRFTRYYKDKFELALEKSIDIGTEPRILLTKAGSNVGEKLNSLLHPSK